MILSLLKSSFPVGNKSPLLCVFMISIMHCMYLTIFMSIDELLLMIKLERESRGVLL